MNPADAFLADIIEHPDDDAPRLIYADWLDEHGDEARAEFIRVQIELSRAPDMDEARRDALEAREAALLRRHAEEWRARVPLPEGIAWDETWRVDLLDFVPVFERG